MAVPDGFLAGTLSFIVLVGGFAILFAVMRACGSLTPMSQTNMNVFVSITCAFMWLTWTCTLFHQWHPLVRPAISAE